MEEKIRVWERGVTKCVECYFYDGYTEGCPYIGNIETGRIIHPDCPFKQPLTKEDIESLGFEEIGQEEYYLNGDLKSWNIERLYEEGNPSFYRIELPDSDYGFKTILFATIKNLPELKFICKTIGIPINE